jgi:hypothetical protein
MLTKGGGAVEVHLVIDDRPVSKLLSLFWQSPILFMVTEDRGAIDINWSQML